MKTSLEEYFFGTVTVGERGQVVIPADARKTMDLHAGDKLLVMGHPAKQGVFLCKIDAMREFSSFLVENIKKFESEGSETSE